MSILYVANLSNHRHVFLCQLPENRKLWKQPIGPFSQQRIAGDMSPEDIAAILDHHKRYGLVHWTEARKSRGFVGLCYSIDAPIRIETFFETKETNDTALNLRSEQIHEESAVAMIDKLSHDLGKPVQRLEVENIEDKKTGAPSVSQGIEVVRPGVQPKHQGGNVRVRR